MKSTKNKPGVVDYPIILSRVNISGYAPD